MGHPKRTKLNPSLRSISVEELHDRLSSMVIGQPDVVDKVTQVVEIYKAGLTHPNKPISTIMSLGPTGTGKTKVVESLAEILFGDEKSFIRVDCGEYSSGGSYASFVGARAGYIGYDSSETVFTKVKLNKFKTKEWPISIVLFDEIEKADDSIFKLLLSILDKATLKLSTGEVIDFSNCIIFMTSNLGAEKVSSVTNPLGFLGNTTDSLKMEAAAIKAVEKRFTPEFFNRIDHTVVFKPLQIESLHKILELELNKVKQRIFTSNSPNKFTFMLTDKAQDLIIEEGFNGKYGARQLKRVIEKHITNPLSTLMMTNQVEFGDLAVIACHNGTLNYEKIANEDVSELCAEDWEAVKAKLKTEDMESIHANGLVARAS